MQVNAKFMIIAAVLFALCGPISAQGAEAGQRPHAVIVVGTQHYSPHETMPVFAKQLEAAGFRCTVLVPPGDPEQNKNKAGIPGLEALDDADVAIFFMRFLTLSDAQMKHIVRYVESGKPVVGLRTSSHAFKYPKGHKHFKWNDGFGRDVLGSKYFIHLSGSTEIEVADGAGGHAILDGVDAPFTAHGTLYKAEPAPGAIVLLNGTGFSKKIGRVVNGFGTHDLKVENTWPAAWTWKNQWGGRVFTSTLGHPDSMKLVAVNRLLVNGVRWAVAANDGAEASGASEASGAPNRTLIYGNSFVGRMQEAGYFEAFLQVANPNEGLHVRAMANTGDQVHYRIRPARFGNHLKFLVEEWPASRVLMCFGINESFAGADGEAQYAKNLERYFGVIKQRHPGSELVFVSSIAIEQASSPALLDASQRNKDIARYVSISEEVANRNGVRFIDLYRPTLERYGRSERPLTHNGMHLNERGNLLVGKILAQELDPGAGLPPRVEESSWFKALVKTVSKKASQVRTVYRPTNGIHYYGLRARDFEYEVEIPHHIKLADLLDEEIQKQACDPDYVRVDAPLPQAKAVAPKKPPRKGLGTLLTTEEDLENFTVADGYEVNLFASNEEFPELANPLQIAFDARGRLWVATFGHYPIPVPGAMPNDRILIFEDTDGDGRADKRTVFADGLMLPDGFVFRGDGVVVSVPTKLLWLRDTDHDDRADTTVELMRGFDNTDSHHGGFLSYTPQGKVTIFEGVFHRAQIESPWGVLHVKNATALNIDLGAERPTIERQTAFPNPWKVSYNQWGQAFQMFGGGQTIDADYYSLWTPMGLSLPSMGMPFRHDKGSAIAAVSSDHFPAEWQGGVVSGHLLGRNAVIYTPLAPVGGAYVQQGEAVDLLTSTNKSFRPVDMVFGLDGALYISDFYYPIIGHAQHSVRDENRDFTHGRIWRLTNKGRPLSKAPRIEGASLDALLGLLGHHQVRVRELARLQLDMLERDAVIERAGRLWPRLDAAGEQAEMHRLEILWLFERFGHDDPRLLRELFSSPHQHARAAAVKSLRYWAPLLEKEGFERAKIALADPSDRVKMAAVSSISYLQNEDHAWRRLLMDIHPEKETPLANMLQQTGKFDTVPAPPEVPILTVSPDTAVTMWDKKEWEGTLWMKAGQAVELIIGVQGNAYMNLDVNALPVIRSSNTNFSKDTQAPLDLQAGLNEIRYFIGGDAPPLGLEAQKTGKVKKLPSTVDIYISDTMGNRPKGLLFAKNAAELKTWGEEYRKEYASVSEGQVYIKAIPGRMAYNLTSFTVKAGAKMKIIFENPDLMIHNLVIVSPGRGDAVGMLADQLATTPQGFMKGYIPESEYVLFATPLVNPRQKVELEFTVPDKPGVYPILCTFPGHWRLMQSKMIVVP